MELTPDEMEIVRNWRELKKRKFGEMLITLKSNGTEAVIENRIRDKIKITA